MLLILHWQERDRRSQAKSCQTISSGELHYYLGLKVVQDKESGGVHIGQPVYAENILQQFGMEKARL